MWSFTSCRSPGLPVDGSKELWPTTGSLLWVVQQVSRPVCQKCTENPERCPSSRGGVPARRLFQREGEGCLCLEAVLANRVLFYFFFCHHTFYFCASLVCTAAFVSLLLPWFVHFIFNFLLLLCSPGILLHCLILYLGGICQLIMKWKCINSPGLPFSVRRK